MYLITLVFFIILWHDDHRNVWTFSVRHLPSPGPKSTLSSEPPSPVLPRFNARQLPVMGAPIPGPVTSDPQVLQPQSYGVDSGYTVELYEPQLPQVPPVSRPFQAAETESEDRSYPSSFYPQLVHNAMRDTPVVARPTASGQRSSSPSPLGDWPRRDVLTQPVRPKPGRDLSRAQTIPTSHISASRPSGPRTMR